MWHSPDFWSRRFLVHPANPQPLRAIEIAISIPANFTVFRPIGRMRIEPTRNRPRVVAVRKRLGSRYFLVAVCPTVRLNERFWFFEDESLLVADSIVKELIPLPGALFFFFTNGVDKFEIYMFAYQQILNPNARIL